MIKLNKNFHRKIVLLFASLAFCASAFAQNSSTIKESSPQVRQKTFEKIWETVNEKYFDANFGGIDWKAAHDRYAPQVAQVKSDAEFYNLIKAMLGEP